MVLSVADRVAAQHDRGAQSNMWVRLARFDEAMGGRGGILRHQADRGREGDCRGGRAVGGGTSEADAMMKDIPVGVENEVENEDYERPVGVDVNADEYGSNGAIMENPRKSLKANLNKSLEVVKSVDRSEEQEPAEQNQEAAPDIVDENDGTFFVISQLEANRTIACQVDLDFDTGTQATTEEINEGIKALATQYKTTEVNPN